MRSLNFNEPHTVFLFIRSFRQITGMKGLVLWLGILLFTLPAYSQKNIEGAWLFQQDNITHLVMVVPGYYSYAVYTPQQFLHTEGGTWRGFSDTSAIETTSEFNATDITQVKEKKTDSSFFNRFHFQLQQPISGWKKLPSPYHDLEAVWRISERAQQGEMKTIPDGSRKTIKLIAGDRFLWAAINTATGEFFGAGGGEFSYTPGSYIEKIRFFSRDNSKAGLELQFNDTITQEKWDHQGKSSKGDPIHEIWVRMY